MVRWLVGGILVSAATAGALWVGGLLTVFQPPNSHAQNPAGGPKGKVEEGKEARATPFAGETRPSPNGRPPALTPVVIPECRLAAAVSQQVPSQRDGQLLFIGRDLEPGEPLPPPDRHITETLGFVGIEVQPGEVVPEKQLVTIMVEKEMKRYRPLKENDELQPDKLYVGKVVKHFYRLREDDAVKKGQLLGLLDPTLAIDEFAINMAQVVASEAEWQLALAIRAETEQRLRTSEQLMSRKAISLEEYRTSQLNHDRARFEEVSKRQAIQLARRELNQARTIVSLYEIRSKIDGVLGVIARKPGEAVKSLEAVFHVRNPRRLEIEGQADWQQLPILQAMRDRGGKLVVEPTHPVPPRQELHGHLLEVTAVAVSKDAKSPLVLSASEDATVRVWDPSSGRERWVLPHPAPVRALAASPPGAEGNLCLSGAADGTARLWDLDQSPAPQPRLLSERHQGAILAVAFSPDGKHCVTGGEDRTICLWDTATGNLRYRFPPAHRGRITSLQFTADGKLFSAAGDNTLVQWEVGADQARPGAVRFDRRSGDLAVPGVSPDGKWVLLDTGKELRVVAVPQGWTEGLLQNPPGWGRFTHMALFSPDARLILTAAEPEGRLQLWRAPTATTRPFELRQLVWKASPATCAAFAPNGAFLVTGMKGRQVLIWPTPRPEEITQRLEAEITLIEPVVEPGSRKVRLKVEMDNPTGALLPGGTATLVAYP